MSIAIIIPARLASTRLPRKLLLTETGRPLIRHTYESATRSTLAKEVIVATDSTEIADAIRSFEGHVEFTSPECNSGTDRVADVAARLKDVEVIVNVQGDEPEIDGTSIDLAIDTLARDQEAVISTLATPIRSKQRLLDPACVKVVIGAGNRALYFSRAPIPFARDWDDALLDADPPVYFQHIGIYAYRREFLLQFAATKPAGIEQVECLEQLRALHGGHKISVGIVPEAAKGIDTLDDYRHFVARWTATNDARRLPFRQ